MRRSLTAISGGPGTGKTSVVVSILRVLARLGVDLESVALAAPTGKAAKRMEESVQKGLLAIPNRSEVDEEILECLPEARTLHRLLGYSPKMGGFRHHENNPLANEIVIIDEASMIDLGLMDRLLRAVPMDARLILLGDADQLPSVDAGAVFRDLLPPKEGVPDDDPRRDASVVLSESYRMDLSDSAGRNILKVAAKINAGQAESLFDPNAPQDETITERPSVDELTFHGAELLAEGNKTQKKNTFLERWFTDPKATRHKRRTLFSKDGLPIE
jgi:exodeoxyribonuclease V alpha subunit